MIDPEPKLISGFLFRLGASREEIANEAAATEDKYQRASRQVEEMKALAQVNLCSREFFACPMS